MRIISGAAERNKGTSQIASTAIRLSLNKRFIILRRVMESRLAWVGILVWVGLIFMAFTAELISPYDPTALDFGAVLSPPSRTHLLGTDDLGRDVLSNLIHGSRVSLQVGLVSVGLATVLGILMGLLAGYWGGWADDVLMRLVDAFYAFPTLILALAITAALGPSLSNVMLAVGIVNAPAFARLVRGQVLSVKERDFVIAAYVVGVSHGRMLRYHIWPNVTAPLIVQASLSIAGAILSEASLSFLGMGAPPPTPSWGAMLKNGYGFLEQAPWSSFFPGAAIFITVLGLNFLGDGLRMALDPRLWQRGKA